MLSGDRGVELWCWSPAWLDSLVCCMSRPLPWRRRSGYKVPPLLFLITSARPHESSRSLCSMCGSNFWVWVSVPTNVWTRVTPLSYRPHRLRSHLQWDNVLLRGFCRSHDSRHSASHCKPFSSVVHDLSLFFIFYILFFLSSALLTQHKVRKGCRVLQRRIWNMRISKLKTLHNVYR